MDKLLAKRVKIAKTILGVKRIVNMVKLYDSGIIFDRIVEAGYSKRRAEAARNLALLKELDFKLYKKIIDKAP